MRVQTKSIFMIVFALGLLSRPPAFAAMIQPAVGGPGGKPFSAHCPEGEILTGLALRAGDEIDAVAPICAEAATAASINEKTIKTPPPFFGGSGGNPASLMCGSGLPAIVSVYVQNFRKIDMPDTISISCDAAKKGRRSLYGHAGPSYSGVRPEESAGRWVSSDPNDLSDGELSGSSTCAKDEVAIGVHGASGDRVDRLGLICDTPVVKPPWASTTIPSGAIKRPPPKEPGGSKPSDISRPHRSDFPGRK